MRHEGWCEAWSEQSQAGAAGVVGGTAVAVVPNAIVKALRPVATRRAGMFFGDVFAYLAKRNDIQRIITQALQTADSKRSKQDEHLVVIAHSMGGNIVYDLLTSTLRGKFEVDAFVTVGSQVGLFKELALFTEDAAGASQGPIKSPPPDRVKAWINVRPDRCARVCRRWYLREGARLRFLQ
jgi:hypothetical protein